MALAEHTLQEQLPAGSTEAAAPAADTARRIQRLVAAFRLMVGLALLLAALLNREPPLLDTRYPDLFTLTATLYTLFGAAALLLQGRQP